MKSHLRDKHTFCIEPKSLSTLLSLRLLMSSSSGERKNNLFWMFLKFLTARQLYFHSDLLIYQCWNKLRCKNQFKMVSGCKESMDCAKQGAWDSRGAVYYGSKSFSVSDSSRITSTEGSKHLLSLFKWWIKAKLDIFTHEYGCYGLLLFW